MFYLLSRWFDNLDITRHDGSIAQVYLMLIATTSLTGPHALAGTAADGDSQEGQVTT